MKPLITLALIASTLVLSGCEAYVVDHRPTYVERRHVYADDYYYRQPYYRSHVVVESDPYYSRRPYYRRAPYYGSTHVEYYSDRRGRYYVRNGHRVYVNVH